jgi:hypothetical protein
MANAKTQEMMENMLLVAREGRDIIPAFFQPLRGRSNTVGAAIRILKAQGLIEQNGVDGTGKPKYALVMPTATHAGVETVQ